MNDLCSAFYPLAAASPVMRRLDLDRPRAAVAARAARARAPDARRPVPEPVDRPRRDRGVARRRTTRVTATPGDHLDRRWDDLEPALLAPLPSPVPAGAGRGRLAAPLRAARPARFARFALLSVRRLSEEQFGGRGAAPAARRQRAARRPARPRRTSAGFLGLDAQRPRAGVRLPGARGWRVGPERRAGRAGCERGGEVHCDAPVTPVEVRVGPRRRRRAGRRDTIRADRGGPRRRRRAAALPPTSWPPSTSRRSLLADLDRFQWDDATFKVDWTLYGSDPVAVRAGPATRAPSTCESASTASP